MVLDKMMLMDATSADKTSLEVVCKVGTKVKLVGKTTGAGVARGSGGTAPACKKLKATATKVSQKERMLAICCGAV